MILNFRFYWAALAIVAWVAVGCSEPARQIPKANTSAVVAGKTATKTDTNTSTTTEPPMDNGTPVVENPINNGNPGNTPDTKPDTKKPDQTPSTPKKPKTKPSKPRHGGGGASKPPVVKDPVLKVGNIKSFTLIFMRSLADKSNLELKTSSQNPPVSVVINSSGKAVFAYGYIDNKGHGKYYDQPRNASGVLQGNEIALSTSNRLICRIFIPKGGLKEIEWNGKTYLGVNLIHTTQNTSKGFFANSSGNAASTSGAGFSCHLAVMKGKNADGTNRFDFSEMNNEVSTDLNAKTQGVFKMVQLSPIKN